MTKPAIKYLNAPFGYDLSDKIEWSDRKRLMAMAHSLVDDSHKEYHDTVDGMSIYELRQLFKDNGFTFDKKFQGDES